MKVSMDALNEHYIKILEQENEKLKADVARLRNLMLELKHLTVATGWLATYRHDFETALSATASSDAWLKERDAKIKLEYLQDLTIQYAREPHYTDSDCTAGVVGWFNKTAAELRASTPKDKK